MIARRTLLIGLAISGKTSACPVDQTTGADPAGWTLVTVPTRRAARWSASSVVVSGGITVSTPGASRRNPGGSAPSATAAAPSNATTSNDRTRAANAPLGAVTDWFGGRSPAEPRPDFD